MQQKTIAQTNGSIESISKKYQTHYYLCAMVNFTPLPKQRIPESQKTESWHIENVKAFISMSRFGTTDRRSYLKSLYDFYNGIIDEEDYDYVLRPYGKTRSNFPSKMRNYPIIKPIIDLLLGEKSKRPLEYTVTVQNSDSISIKEEQKKARILENIKAMFINELAEQGVVDAPEQEVQMPDQLVKEFDMSYVDNRAIRGQAALNYIMYFNELYDKLQKQFFHFLTAGEVFSEKGVRRGEVFYDIINPMDVDYDKDPDVEFIEDGDFALRRRFAHASSIIDAYGDKLTAEQVLALETPEQTTSDVFLLYKMESTGPDPNLARNRLIEVITVYWKTRKRYAFLKYTDPATGSVEETIVPENYKLTPEDAQLGAVLTYEWGNEVRQGTQIDGRFYVDLGPVPTQRKSLDNPSLCKLPINGRKYSDVNSQNISLVSLGIPYQLNYNIYKYRLELAIARSKDIIAQFDINMIPKNWDMDKFMYFVEGTGIAWVDYNKEGITLSPQHQSVLDMSIKTISQYLSLLDSIVLEWEKVSGVTRQRQGQMGVHEGKATSQQSIVQSSHITEDIFRKFSHFEQRELQGLLDYSKEAWLNGKKSMYIMPDGTTNFLDIDSLIYSECEFGIFVSDSGKDIERKEKLEALSQAMVQNGVPISTIASIFKNESFAQIEQKIKEVERAQAELEKAVAEAERAKAEEQAATIKYQTDMQAVDKEKDRQLAIELALIKAESDESSNAADLKKAMEDLEVKKEALALKEKEITLKHQAAITDKGTE